MKIYGIKEKYYDAEYETHEYTLSPLYRKKEEAETECKRRNEEEYDYGTNPLYPAYRVVTFELK